MKSTESMLWHCPRLDSFLRSSKVKDARKHKSDVVELKKDLLLRQTEAVETILTKK